MRRSIHEIAEGGEGMGTWDVGPFDNDDAADFAGDLDDAPEQARIEMIGAVLGRVADPADDDSRLSDAPRAVAAAALIAAQCPGGAPVDHGYGPSTPMPQFPAYLRELAINALDCVMTKPTWLAEAWGESPNGPEWRRTISDLRTVLDPPQEETLFAL
jgi:Domain of unknown function (DUF4259)